MMKNKHSDKVNQTWQQINKHGGKRIKWMNKKLYKKKQSEKEMQKNYT